MKFILKFTKNFKDFIIILKIDNEPNYLFIHLKRFCLSNLSYLFKEN
jgi:hypothetical protein